MSNEKKTYEAMILLEATSSDFETASEPIRGILDRYDATVLSMQPWEERRLAYEIRGHKRGLYVLTYFDADPSRLAEIHHDCELNQQILRVLILLRDHVPAEELGVETPAIVASLRAAKLEAQKALDEAEKAEKAEKASEEVKTQEQAEKPEQPASTETAAETQEPVTPEKEGSDAVADENSQTDASPEPESS